MPDYLSQLPREFAAEEGAVGHRGTASGKQRERDLSDDISGQATARSNRDESRDTRATITSSNQIGKAWRLQRGQVAGDAPQMSRHALHQRVMPGHAK